jgi:hypothetical protein
MKSVTIFQLHPKSRMAGLGAAMGLAAILVVALLLGSQQASGARASSFAPQSSTQIAQLPTAPKATLLVATSPDFWPMEYISGTQIVGHDIDLMNAIAAKIGVTVVYTTVPDWDHVFQGLIAGKHDVVISTVSITPERDEVIDYTLPYVTFVGNDNIAIAVQQGNDVLRRQSNEALWQLRTDGTLATNVALIAADMPAWQPRLPDWPYIPPDTESILVYTDTNQCLTVIQIPRDAVTETILLAYAAANTATTPSDLAFAGHAFELDAYQNGIFAPGFTFSVPVTITIHYTDTDLAGMDKTTLGLYYWNNNMSKWEDVATTCIPHSAYDRHPNENWLAVAVCHLSKFALFGRYRIYLPLVLRN